MYLCRFRFRHTATDAADTSVFAMRNPVASGKYLAISRVILTVGFDGTSAAAEVGHGFCRFSGATPTGGTSPTRAKLHSLAVASAIPDASIKEGAVLTLAASFEGYFHELVIPATAGSVLSHVIDFPGRPFRIDQGEGIAIRNTLVAVIGATVSGSIWWSEETI